MTSRAVFPAQHTAGGVLVALPLSLHKAPARQRRCRSARPWRTLHGTERNEDNGGRHGGEEDHGGAGGGLQGRQRRRMGAWAVRLALRQDVWQQAQQRAIARCAARPPAAHAGLPSVAPCPPLTATSGSTPISSIRGPWAGGRGRRGGQGGVSIQCINQVHATMEPGAGAPGAGREPVSLTHAAPVHPTSVQR